MKTWMFYVSSMVLIISMGVIIFQDRPMISPQLLSVSHEYALISDQDDHIDVSLYLNVEKHDMIDIDQHISAYLSNPSGTKKMDIFLMDIQEGKKEYYLDVLWTEWIFHYELSIIGYDFMIEDLYLEITLENGDQYEIHLGKLYITDLNHSVDVLDWHRLSASKAKHSLFSRIDQIEIGYHNLQQEIIDISVGTGVSCNFLVHSNHISIIVPFDYYLLNRVPIIITFSDGSIQLISSFTFIIEHQILKESGMLVKTYALY